MEREAKASINDMGSIRHTIDIYEILNMLKKHCPDIPPDAGYDFYFDVELIDAHKLSFRLVSQEFDWGADKEVVIKNGRVEEAANETKI